MHCHIEPKCSKTRTHHGQSNKKTDSTLRRPQFPHPFLEDWIGADFGGLAFDPSLLTEAIDENQTRQPNPWTKRGGNLKSLSGPLTTMDVLHIVMCHLSAAGHGPLLPAMLEAPSARQSVDLQGGGSCTGEKGQIREKRDGRIRRGGGGRQATWETAAAHQCL